MVLMIKGEDATMKVVIKSDRFRVSIKSRNKIGSSKSISLNPTFFNLGLLKDWWAKSTAEKYLERAQCIVDQYGNFTSKQVGMPINGINSQGENIADHGGMKESYGAYRKNKKDHEI